MSDCPKCKGTGIYSTGEGTNSLCDCRAGLEQRLVEIFGPDDPNHSCAYCKPDEWEIVDGEAREVLA